MTTGTEELRVGQYRLLTLLGEGGMGVVHLAEGPDGRRVAVKVLRPHIIGDQEARDRLAREVGSLQRVRSARVAEFLDADPHGPIPFVVTRYVPGLPLHRHLDDEGPLDEADLHHFARTLAEGLDDVHRAGVLHRDIKPANVLLEGRSPVLIDFGLARVAEDPRLTQTGHLLGTPGYLAAEVLYGDPPTPASDVHAWAGTVVYAATGRSPYGGGPAMAVLDRVRRGQSDLAGVPASLVPLLGEALDPDPLNRPSVLELRQALDSAPRVAPQQVLPTMPLVAGAPLPVGLTGDAEPTTVLGAPVAGAASIAEAEPTVVVPRPAARVAPSVPPVREPEPFPLWDDTGEFVPSAAEQDHERYADQDDDALPDEWEIAAEPAPVTRPSKLGTLGLGAAAVGLVALAPYLGAAVLLAVVALLRFSSVTRQRHRRRRELRGRARWFDAPVSTVSTPGYLVLSLGGTLVLGLWTIASAIATAGVMMLVSPSLPVGMVVVAAVFVLGLWWGPASGRVREMTRLARSREGRRGAQLTAVLGLALGVALVAALVARGPIWSPQVDAPWQHGVLRDLAERY